MPRQIPISKGYIATVSDEDYERLMAHKWTVSVTATGGVYARRMEMGKNILMHKEVLGVQPGKTIDHRDLDGLNNTRENLRYATMSQQMGNSRAKGSVHGFKGVFRRPGGRYGAQVTFRGRHKSYGSFATAEEAALAYDICALQLFGEFARPNLLPTIGGAKC